MLRNLLLREWILNRRAALSTFAIFIAFEACFAIGLSDSPRTWMVFASIYVSFLASVLYLREDKFRAAESSCILPVTRLEIVRARFIGSWSALLIAFASVVAITAFLPGSKVSVAGILEPSTLLISGAVVTFVISLMLPFSIRYGFAGVMIVAVGGQILGVAVLVLASALGGGGIGAVRALFSAVVQGLLALREGLSPGLFALLCVLLLLLVNWAGYRFAVFLFQRRDL